MQINQQLLSEIQSTIERALKEDIGAGDLTAGLVPEDATIGATIVTRETMTMAGCG